MEHNFSETLTIRKPEVKSQRGIVASQHKLASREGAKILAKGGNAVDAAVTTAFAISVLEPWMSGIGGGGHMLIREPLGGAIHAIDYGMCSPINLDPKDYPLSGEGISSNLFPWPSVLDNRNVIGATSIAVPGHVDGMRVALENFGTISWEESLQPAIHFAEEGIQLDWYSSLMIGAAAKDLNRFPFSRETFLEQGYAPVPPWNVASQIRKKFPYLARTLKHLSESGPRDFYEGKLGQTLIEDIQTAGGILSKDDLSRYKARLQKPISRDYHDASIYVHQELNAGASLLRALDLLDKPLSEMKPVSADAFQVLIEVLIRVYGERLEKMGDIDGGRDMSCTTHLCVIDADGGMVTLTQTLLGIFGSKLVLPQTGILMNNGIMWFNPESGHPNTLEPDKVCLANTCPAIGIRDRGEFALGASGGRRILPAVLQLIHFLVDADLSLENAFHQPRIDHTGGDYVVIDRTISPQVRETIKNSFLSIDAEHTSYPLYFACPTAVMRQSGNNFGATAITHPWAEAVKEPDE